ncbi:MAG: glycosyltransferase family 4 protein [Lactobacillaceae bacterium]|jgi:glycosyltransferase involved in cell wall biosynthesis|nr:glycosyltransferase family 4 protein [Lactobacillaceae bacterium]
MKIGIDLKELQTASAYRGIGEVTKQVTNKLLPLLAKDKNVDEVTLFMYRDKENEVFQIINVSADLKYNIKYYDPSTLVTGRLDKLKNAFFSKKDPLIEEMDVYLSFSVLGYVPKANNVYLVWYDLIPLVFEDRFTFADNKIILKKILKQRLVRGLIKKIKKQLIYKDLKKSKKIISISNFSKNEILRIYPDLNVDIDVASLGVDEKPAKTLNTADKDLPNKPYLLFIGSPSPRRQLEQLVTQFNDLKQKGYDFQLVLAGKPFEKIQELKFLDLKNVILESPYRNDIITIGYISDEYKAELYAHSLAFVYPTLYEGFGLPVLESMLNKTLILTYNNSSLPEVGGKYAFYADDSSQIADKVIEMYNLSDEERQQIIEESYEYAKQFTWAKTAQRYYDIIMEDFN